MSQIEYLKNKTIAITQIRLHDYAGSEIVTLELADFFSRNGANVIVITHTFGGAIAQEFKKLKNVKIIESSHKNFNTVLEEAPIDIVWVHHQFIPEVLINKPDIHYIYHHMSPFVELESPLFWRIEETLADVILFNSQETRDTYLEKGYFASCKDKLLVLNNAAPPEFFTFSPERRQSARPKKINIISNHPPKELVEAREMLLKVGIKVDSFGTNEGQRQKRITPKDIASTDVIVTIGKTVQYSLAVGTPVYCYDHFGGPGYLNKANFEKAKALNFSGRGFKKKKADKIVEEIIKEYSSACKFMEYAKNKLAQDFRLDYKLEEIIDRLYQIDTQDKKEIASLDVESYLSNMRIIERNVRGIAERQADEITSLYGHIAKLTQMNKDLTIELENANKLLNETWNSKAFKLARTMRHPVNITKNVLRRYPKRKG